MASIMVFALTYLSLFYLVNNIDWVWLVRSYAILEGDTLKIFWLEDKAIWLPIKLSHVYLAVYSPYQVGDVLERECIECKGTNCKLIVPSNGNDRLVDCPNCNKDGIQRRKIGPIELVQFQDIWGHDKNLSAPDNEQWLLMSPTEAIK